MRIDCKFVFFFLSLFHQTGWQSLCCYFLLGWCLMCLKTVKKQSLLCLNLTLHTWWCHTLKQQVILTGVVVFISYKFLWGWCSYVNVIWGNKSVELVINFICPNGREAWCKAWVFFLFRTVLELFLLSSCGSLSCWQNLKK